MLSTIITFVDSWSSNIESHNHNNFDGKIQSNNYSLFGSLYAWQNNFESTY